MVVGYGKVDYGSEFHTVKGVKSLTSTYRLPCRSLQPFIRWLRKWQVPLADKYTLYR